MLLHTTGNILLCEVWNFHVLNPFLGSPVAPVPLQLKFQSHNKPRAHAASIEMMPLISLSMSLGRILFRIHVMIFAEVLRLINRYRRNSRNSLIGKNPSGQHRSIRKLQVKARSSHLDFAHNYLGGTVRAYLAVYG
jgi:hypothetical protein